MITPKMRLEKKQTANSRKINRKVEHFIKQSKGKPGIRVGFPNARVTYPKTKVPVVNVAFWNEFGTKNIPERSFLRSTMIAHNSYKAEIRKIGKGVFKSAKNATVELEKLGAKAVGDIQKTITDVRIPPNAASTAEIKRSRNPLIDTGFLRSSVTYELITKKELAAAGKKMRGGE